MPVLDSAGAPRGMLHELDLLEGLIEGRLSREQAVDEVVKPLQGRVAPETSLSDLQRLLREGLAAVVTDEERLIGLLTQIDLIDYISQQEATP
jgi:cystathionine beta-synthase